MRILVVDDSKAMRMIVVRTLHLAGYEEHEIVQAENGRHAIEVISGAPPDLVLCDWNMPEMSGLNCSPPCVAPAGRCRSGSSPQRLRLTCGSRR